MSDNLHEEAHNGPIKNPKQLLLAAFYAFVVPIFVIIGLVIYVASGNKPAEGAANPELAIESRIQKVGLVEIKDANRALVAGELVYKTQCAACHSVGAAGAPKFADASAWALRIKTGYEALLNSALVGKGAMGAQGGGDYEDTEIGRAVVHMANAAGAKFAEPQRPVVAGAEGAAAVDNPAAAPASAPAPQ